VQGARAVQKGVLGAFPNADLEVMIAWISMMDGDTYEAAEKAAAKFSDVRANQFYDPQKLTGRALAESLGHKTEVAWDMYLFYPTGTIWQENPPPPETYVHQLPNSWADQSRDLIGFCREVDIS